MPVAESYQQAWQHAREIQAPYFIKGELDRLGETVIVSIALYQTADGSKVWSDMLKARNPDDLDPILLKLAKAMGTSKRASEETDIYSVTDYESAQLKQVNARNFFGVFLGGAFVNSTSSGSIPAGFGLSVSHDMRKLMADLSGEVYFGPTSLYFFNINAFYPFNSTNNTPYLGGGLGVGGVSFPDIYQTTTTLYGSQTTTTDTHDNGGLLLSGGGGYLFNRTSNVRIRAGAKAMVPLFKVHNVLPLGVVFNLELQFGR